MRLVLWLKLNPQIPASRLDVRVVQTQIKIVKKRNPQENRKLRPGEVIEEKKVIADILERFLNATRYSMPLRHLTVSLRN